MKFLIKTSVRCCLILFLLVSCSDNDSLNLISENYLSAKIDGVAYQMDSNTATMTATRIIGPEGISKLRLEAISSDGQIIRFSIPEYKGKSVYMMGENPMLPNIMEYEKISPYGHWFCNNPGPNEVEKNFVEIIADDGEFIDGNFNLSAQNFDDNSILRITEGKFRVLAN